MPPALIASMSHPQPLPHLEVAEDEMKQDEDDPDSGALIRWEKADGGASGHVALMGIRTVILCLVLCLGRMVQDGMLRCYHVDPHITLFRLTASPPRRVGANRRPTTFLPPPAESRT